MENGDTPQIITHIEHNLNHCLFDCKWIPCSAKFVVIGSLPKGSGTLEIFEINSGELRKIKEIERPNSFKCGTFGASSDIERKLATGDFKGALEIWDLEKSGQVYITKEHTDIINSIDGMGGNTLNCGAPEIVTGSRDGTVKVWDPRQRGKPVANMQPVQGETRRDCWAVAFGNSFNDAERIVIAGYDNGDLKMFDLRTMSLRWECNLKNGVCYTEFDRKDIPMNKLVATTLEGKFHVFDLRTQNPSKGFAQVLDNSSKSGTIWVARHVPQNRDLFLTCAGNGQVSLWKYEYPEQRYHVDSQGVAVGVPGKLRRLQRMVISSQPINSLEWNRDHLGLAVATAYDQYVRVLVTTKLNLQ
ncbi:dynein axonemal assembly factor 10 [Vanessa atalanta]|uniref:dynein axonemal assembly factor 10 n=1 Tax=Vanessa cardui TaxID=171605 RepID=UPI001F147400|nr:dynein axonemal assembly factor 10 [Vanessa cardui]XP_047536662.1 dynein axonemal assembly factor 10 [Vanessa atalanta]